MGISKLRIIVASLFAAGAIAGVSAATVGTVLVQSEASAPDMVVAGTLDTEDWE